MRYSMGLSQQQNVKQLEADPRGKLILGNGEFLVVVVYHVNAPLVMPCYAIQIPGNPGNLVVLMWIYEPHQLYTISLKDI